MNGISTTGFVSGWPATAVWQLGPTAPVAQPRPRSDAAEEALAAALHYPPRTGEVRPLAALLPDVLARYQLDPA